MPAASRLLARILPNEGKDAGELLTVVNVAAAQGRHGAVTVLHTRPSRVSRLSLAGHFVSRLARLLEIAPPLLQIKFHFQMEVNDSFQPASSSPRTPLSVIDTAFHSPP